MFPALCAHHQKIKLYYTASGIVTLCRWPSGLFDYISLLFIGFVFIISSLVILYSDDYMFGYLNIVRFISLVLIFVVCIMFLIISPNIISILLGWNGLGLVSYLLAIYSQNVRSYGAGMLTVLSNRIGDVALLEIIVWIVNFGS